MSRKGQVAIPHPTTDVHSLFTTAMANKELTETLAGQRGSTLDSAVTWGDLVELGLISPDQVPEDLGRYPR